MVCVLSTTDLFLIFLFAIYHYESVNSNENIKQNRVTDSNVLLRNCNLCWVEFPPSCFLSRVYVNKKFPKGLFASLLLLTIIIISNDRVFH